MYLSKNKHIISIALFISSCITLLAQAVNAVLRLAINRKYSDAPDMLNSVVFKAQHIVAAVEILGICIVFFLALKKLARLKTMFDDDEEREIAQLQREYNIGGISSINVEAMSQLTSIWAFILIGARVIYEIISWLYTAFIEKLYMVSAVSSPEAAEMIVSIYNDTHAFKYQGMFIAISIGIFITGVFLKDRFLKIFAVVMSLLFVIASYASNMTSINAMGRTIGVVWTSVIFHIFQTIGLMFIAVYLAKKHKGM